MADQPPPVLNGSVWRALRAQFNQKFPRGEVTSNYLATVLSLQDGAAKNVLRNLKLLGLVGEDNQLTQLAIRWRDDEQFADACRDIAKHAYPMNSFPQYRGLIQTLRQRPNGSNSPDC